MDVAIQTMAVDATVTASHSPVARTRGRCTSRGCPVRGRSRAKGALNRRARENGPMRIA
jgi:hypothetical protein